MINQLANRTARITTAVMTTALLTAPALLAQEAGKAPVKRSMLQFAKCSLMNVRKQNVLPLVFPSLRFSLVAKMAEYQFGNFKSRCVDFQRS